MRFRTKRLLIGEASGLAPDQVNYFPWSPWACAVSIGQTIFNHPARQLGFIVLSAADLLLTWWLLKGSGGQVYEANPVASPWLQKYGFYGLAFYKGGLVFMILALVLVIEYLQRPRAAVRILDFGCVSLSLVLCYSSILYVTEAGL